MTEVQVTHTGGLRDRPTGEIAVLILTGIIAFILVVITLGVVVAGFFQPDRDTTAAVGQLFDVLTVILGGVIGYIAGRGTKAAVTKQNGVDVWDPTEPPVPPRRESPPEASP